MNPKHDAPEGEAAQPVAWRYRDAYPGANWLFSDTKPREGSGWAFVEPLYAAPTPPAPSGLVDGWRPMSEEPIGRPITARMRLDDGSWWYARVRVWRHEDGEGGRFGDHGYELLHYNGDVTVGRFYGPFHSWCEIDATLSGQQGGVVPAGDLPPVNALNELERATWADDVHVLNGIATLLGLPDRTEVTVDAVRARLAEQPTPAGTGDADRVEGLRPGIEKALEIVEAERETVSVSSSAYQRLWSVRNTLRAALDGASGQGEG